ncbi:hypothetical protein GQ44DRAFT_727444 [Phaeosphaeriaceae sp. PMI808]|nr:hypothetical protein GQ44DRAFT_727444 [Phaeosphaeriaceae sp. PMI808]
MTTWALPIPLSENGPSTVDDETQPHMYIPELHGDSSTVGRVELSSNCANRLAYRGKDRLPTVPEEAPCIDKSTKPSQKAVAEGRCRALEGHAARPYVYKVRVKAGKADQASLQHGVADSGRFDDGVEGVSVYDQELHLWRRFTLIVSWLCLCRRVCDFAATFYQYFALRCCYCMSVRSNRDDGAKPSQTCRWHLRRVIALFKTVEAGEHRSQQPWTEFQFEPGEYNELERQLRQNKKLWAYAKDKIRPSLNLTSISSCIAKDCKTDIRLSPEDLLPKIWLAAEQL